MPLALMQVKKHLRSKKLSQVFCSQSKTTQSINLWLKDPEQRALNADRRDQGPEKKGLNAQQGTERSLEDPA